MSKFIKKTHKFKIIRQFYRINVNFEIKYHNNGKKIAFIIIFKKFIFNFKKNDYIFGILYLKTNLSKQPFFFYYKVKPNCKIVFIFYNQSSYNINFKFLVEILMNYLIIQKRSIIENWLVSKLVKQRWQYLMFLKYFRIDVYFDIQFRFEKLINFFWLNYQLSYSRFKNTINKDLLIKENVKKLELDKRFCKKNLLGNYNYLSEGNILIPSDLNLNHQNLFIFYLNYSYFSTFIFKNIFLFNFMNKNLMKNFYISLPIQNVIKKKIYYWKSMGETLKYRNVNLKLNGFYYQKKKNLILSADVFMNKSIWIRILYLYIKNIKFRFIKKVKLLYFIKFLNLENSNILNKKQHYILKNFKINFQNIKSIVYKNNHLIILWARFVSEIFFVNKINHLMEIIFFLIKKNYLILNSNIMKKIVTFLELIIGNNGIKSENVKKLFEKKNIFYVVIINSKKIPGKIEKLISDNFSTKSFHIFDFRIFNFYFSFGLVDLCRKIIQKIIIYSNGNLHTTFLKYWLSFETCYISNGVASLILYSLTKNKIKIINEINFLMVKNLNSRNWEYYVVFLKMFLENYGDINIIKKNYKKFFVQH
nr:hypothetical protein Cry52Nrm2_p118 [Cryptomonas curvata]